jgi:crotonobetainyl-CoA:carnitine CoA-transferase CaiB-like acyl-CoA transferase
LKSISEKPGVKSSLLYGMKVVSFYHCLQGPASHAILADAGFSSTEVIELIRKKVVFEPKGVS